MKPMTVRLADLSPEQRRLVEALIRASKGAPEVTTAPEKEVTPMAMSQMAVTARRWSLETVRVAELKVDPRYHDPARFNQRRGDEIAANYNEDFVGTIEISERRTGDRVILDAQHRVYASRKRGVEYLPAKVWHDLTLREEAELFLMLNHTVKMTTYVRFRAGLIAEDPDALAVEAAVNGVGAKISDTESPNNTRAVGTLLAVHRHGVLVEVLNVIVRAWPDAEPGRFSSTVIGGIAASLLAYRTHPDFDRQRLIATLATRTPAVLISNAKSQRALAISSGSSEGTGAGSIVGRFRFERTVIVARYNAGLRSRRLPELTASLMKRLSLGQDIWTR